MGARKESRPSVWSADGGASPEIGRWLGQPGWRLPSGQPLAEFGFRSGFVAPRLVRVSGLSRSRPGARPAKGER
jgi:hypothetical protein